MIARRNILDLIGKHRGKYHSCILTCYSLDFSFFEERVLPILRTANIKNVNVLADGKFLELAQENTTGQEFKYNKTYNFQPVYAHGVFHPKIMLLTGQKHGLLLIGSGNITSSGLSSNDEIWGAFHLDNLENDNAGLFSDVWHYLQQFLNKSYGFLPQKIDWIKKYSPWINQLPKPNYEINLKSLNQSVLFVSNTAKESILQQIFNNAPQKNLEALTIISPYYDQKGEILNELFLHYKPKRFNCILDVAYGIIPKKLEEKVSNNIKFYDWKDCKDDHHALFNRLHAKIIHFQYKDGVEIMLLGSANATTAGMGTGSFKAANYEAGIIIKRKADISWIQELKIKIPKVEVNLNHFENNKKFNHLGIKSKHAVKIVYSELRGAELSIYTMDPPQGNVGVIQIVSRLSLEVESVPFTVDSSKISVACKKPESVFKVCMLDEHGEIISNYSIVHRFESLLRCNPDPNQERLDCCLEQDYPDGEGVTELLTFIDYNWADDNEKIESKYKSGNKRSISETNAPLPVFEKLTSKEFNKVSEEILLKQAGELSNSNLKIAEFLNIVMSGSVVNSDEEFQESEEQKLLEDSEQKGEGKEVQESNKTKNNGRNEKAAISRYFKKLNAQYHTRLKSFFESKALSVTPTEVVNIRVLSNILISLQLIMMYYGKKYSIEVESDNSDETLLLEESYLQEGDLTSDCDTIKGFMIDVFGKFLLLSTAGMKSYDYEVLNQKLSYNRKQLFQRALFITLNMTWLPSEYIYRDTLLLNVLYFLNPDHMSNESFLIELKNQLEDSRLKSKYISYSFANNCKTFFGSLYPRYINWLGKYNDTSHKENIIAETTSLNNGAIIFNRKIGFNVIHKIGFNSHSPKLDLSRSGYEWNDEANACIWDDITYGNKCVVYSI